MALLVSVSTLVASGFTWVAIRQANGEQHLTRDGQVTDRYNAAVTNLGDDAEEVRIGGLYALQRIAQDSPRDASTVVQVISAYVRGHASRPRKGTTLPDQPANDIDAALRILTAPLDAHTPPDLHDAYLAGADLTDANLGDANLAGADLADANLGDANLADANLSDANLSDANLTDANLSRAHLLRADLSRTVLVTNLTWADLAHANLTCALMNGADLTYADLTDANLIHTNLTGARLFDVRGYAPDPSADVHRGSFCLVAR